MGLPDYLDYDDDIAIFDDGIENEDLEKIEEPLSYNIIIYNDDYTPFDFVVDVLEKFLVLPLEEAGDIVWCAHESGRAVCGQYSREVAETIVHKVSEYCKAQKEPLRMTFEPAN